ncbi:MAG: hypothetical protein AB7H90_20520 [Alphaproteobacteria bacterium]
MRKLLAALAVIGLAVLSSPSGAQAATCWWNGYTWVCNMPPHGKHWRGHHRRHAHRKWHRHHRHGRHWDRPHWRHAHRHHWQGRHRNRHHHHHRHHAWR